MAKQKWQKYYNTEEELIADMLLTRTDIYTYPYFSIVKGYGYIDSFKRYYRSHGKLTDKQMTQLKRLAEEVFWNAWTFSK